MGFRPDLASYYYKKGRGVVCHQQLGGDAQEQKLSQHASALTNRRTLGHCQTEPGENPKISSKKQFKANWHFAAN